ncbi:hypothetical protein OSB04_017557, partial [Centaurea solstitialis]
MFYKRFSNQKKKKPSTEGTGMNSIEDLNTMKEKYRQKSDIPGFPGLWPRLNPLAMQPTAKACNPEIKPSGHKEDCRDRTRVESYVLPRNPEYFRICVPMYEASITGDWTAADAILSESPNLIRFAINENYDTALHVATSAEENEQTTLFVANLVNRMDTKDLELQNNNHNTAFCLATAAGNLKMVKIMMNKNRSLMDIPGSQDMLPLYMSAIYRKYETVKYLYDNSQLEGHSWTPQNRGWLLEKCVEAEFFDIALEIVTAYPDLGVNAGSVLGALARNPNAFDGAQQNFTTRIINSFCRITEKDNDALELLRLIWTDNIIKMSKNEVDKIVEGTPNWQNNRLQYSRRILFVAAEMGNTRFIIELLRVNDDNQTIFHVAVKHRHHGIYNLLYEIGAMKDLITPLKDINGNNMLHLVGETSGKKGPKASRVSLVLQRELLWFKEIEKMMPPSLRERKNKANQTPYELFSEKNEDIVSEGIKWVHDCMVVTTLIVTLAFAIPFTVPGSYSQEIGNPNFIYGYGFLIFVVADAISLFSASTSLLVFLYVLTSRHGQHDFMYSLPRKLMIGLLALFMSVAAMIITFSASFFILYRNRQQWLPSIIAVFATMPAVVFGLLQFPLLMDMFRSTFDPRYLFKPKN